MKTNPQAAEATHNHKRSGAVIVLESTNELAKVLIPTSGDEFWVKIIDLTPIVAGAKVEAKPRKKHQSKERPTASANTQYRTVRVA
jgi:hypothetical protein